MKEELHIIKTTGLSWAIETDEKSVNLEDRSRENNLRFEGIKEHENESWEDCKNYILLENKLEMDNENVVIAWAQWIGKKNKNQSQPIVAWFSFYNNKMNILKNYNCKKLKNKIFLL